MERPIDFSRNRHMLCGQCGRRWSVDLDLIDQADRGSQFYLYRVRLVPTVAVRKGWLVDPSNFLGDVVLDEVCPLGVDVARNLNYHEDSGALSLALGRSAIASTQQIAIPLLSGEDFGWVTAAVAELRRLTATSPPPGAVWPTWRRSPPSPRTERACELVATLARQLAVNLRRQFEAAVALDDSLEPESWARYVTRLVNMVAAPEHVSAELDREPVRYL